MNVRARWVRRSLALAAGIVALAFHEAPSPGTGLLLSSAQAIIGRPATPRSYAGVARRTTRRAYAAGPHCTRVVDAYGRAMTRCY